MAIFSLVVNLKAELNVAVHDVMLDFGIDGNNLCICLLKGVAHMQLLSSRFMSSS